MKFHHRLTALILAALLVCALPIAASAYAGGVYTARAEGNNGPLSVEVVMDEGSIVSVYVADHRETAGIGDAAIAQIPAAIVGAQSLAVDTVAGATNTSKAILSAVADCVSQAGGDVAALTQRTEKARETALTPGIYEGSARGYMGDITVHVTVDESAIRKVDIVRCTDVPRNVSDAAVREMPSRIVDSQSVRADTVSGATFTSVGILRATAAALAKAGDAERFNAEIARDVPVQGEDVTVDVLVIGGGGAGCMAALNAQNPGLVGEDTGLSVMMVEKQAFLGGSTMLSGGWIGAAMPLNDKANVENPSYLEAAYERAQSLETSPINKPLLQRELSISGDTVMAMQNLGLALMAKDCYGEADSYASLVGWVLPYANPNPREGEWGKAGAPLGTFFEQRFRESAVDVRLNTAGKELILDGETVIGAVVEDGRSVYNVYAGKVILACGGFFQNQEMIARFYPDSAGVTPFLNGGNTGDGFRMAEAVDAVPVVGHLMGGYLGADFRYGNWNDLSAAIYNGANSLVLVNAEGKRFTSDCAGFTMASLYNEVVQQPGKYAYAVMDANHPAVSDVNASVMQEYIWRADSIAQLASMIHVDAQALEATVAAYNDLNAADEFAVAGEDKLPVAVGPYYAVAVNPIGLASYSGLEVTEYCEIVNAAGQIVPNLYAVGENCFSGSFFAVSNALFTGRIAGEHAAMSLVS